MKPVLLITGGSRGIGASTARAAAARGYAVCINYRQSEVEAEELVSAIRRDGGEAIAVAADVSREEDVVRLFEVVDASLGTIAALVNNAARLEPQRNVVDMDADRLGRIFGTNVVGTIICSREAIRRMSTRRGGVGGTIVNVSSVASRSGSPAEYVDYAASKGAIDTFTVGLAREMAEEGIRVNAVRPGAVHTGIHAAGGEPDRVHRVAQHIPMRRGGKPEEIAAAILWLMSEEASYVTGSLLDVTGGA